jgi:hypothetical protein
MLYEAAQSILHSKRWSWLKAWAMQIARRRGMKKAIVALARRACRIANIAIYDGMILPYDANLVRMKISEGTMIRILSSAE